MEDKAIATVETNNGAPGENTGTSTVDTLSASTDAESVASSHTRGKNAGHAATNVVHVYSGPSIPGLIINRGIASQADVIPVVGTYNEDTEGGGSHHRESHQYSLQPCKEIASKLEGDEKIESAASMADDIKESGARNQRASELKTKAGSQPALDSENRRDQSSADCIEADHPVSVSKGNRVDNGNEVPHIITNCLPLLKDVTLEKICDNNPFKQVMEERVRWDEKFAASADGSVRLRSKAPGVDGITDSALASIIDYTKLTGDLLNGTYDPKPTLTKIIPKANSPGNRSLQIPTSLDKLLQTVITRYLMKVLDATFSGGLHGYRPGRSIITAMQHLSYHYNQGYVNGVKLDITKFFDSVSHSVLRKRLDALGMDHDLIELIFSFLKAGTVCDGVWKPTNIGIPQGSPQSPDLSLIIMQIVADELDRRGVKYVVYADDIIIVAKSKKAAKRLMKSVTRLLGLIELEVNEEKSQIGRVEDIPFLGLIVQDGIIQFSKETRLRVQNSLLNFVKQIDNGPDPQDTFWRCEQYICGISGAYGRLPQSHSFYTITRKLNRSINNRRFAGGGSEDRVLRNRLLMQVQEMWADFTEKLPV